MYYQTRTHETNRQNFSKYFSPRAHRVFHRGTIHKHRQPPLTHSKDSARKQPQTPGNAPSGTQCDSRHSHITGNPARKQPQTPENAPANRLCDSRHSHIAAPAQPRQSKTQQPQRPSHTTTTPDRQCDSNHSHIAKIRHGNTSKCPKNTPSGTQCASRHSHITAPAGPGQSKSQQSQRPSHTTTPPDRKCDSRHSHITGNPARKQPQTPENAPANRLCDSRHSHIARIQHGNTPKCPKDAPSGTQCDSHHSHITAPAGPRQSKSQQSQRPSHTTTTPDRKCASYHSHIARIQHENSTKLLKMPP